MCCGDYLDGIVSYKVPLSPLYKFKILADRIFGSYAAAQDKPRKSLSSYGLCPTNLKWSFSFWTHFAFHIQETVSAFTRKALEPTIMYI